jgi:carboxyl-terminal processing protease
MGSKFKNFGLIGLGMVAGVAVSMQFSALAQKMPAAPCLWKNCASWLMSSV